MNKHDKQGKKEKTDENQLFERTIKRMLGTPPQSSKKEKRKRK